MKYLFLQIRITDGEREYYSSSVHELLDGINVGDYIAEYISDIFPDGNPTEFNHPDIFVFDNGVVVGISQAQEITAEHYQILYQYI